MFAYLLCEELFQFLKISLIGDISLGTAVMGGLTALWAWHKKWPDRWQYRAQGITVATLIIGLISLGQFLYLRWSIDPRRIPPTELDSFVAALGKYDPTQTVIVFCFKSDPSSCAIAGRYQDLIADHWSVERGPNLEFDRTCTPDLVNRVWVYTESTHDRPSGAVTLHRALDAAGMNPGYRLNSAMDKDHFGFGVGCSR
jgi:hypothetical protein